MTTRKQSPSFHTHTHAIITLFWNSSTLTLVSDHLTWGSVTDFIHNESEWNTFYLAPSTPCQPTCMLCECACVCFFNFRLISTNIASLSIHLSIIESGIFPCFIIVIFTVVISMEMMKHEEKYIISNVCLYELKYNPNWTRSFFFVFGLGSCLCDYCDDFDWFGQSAKHWKSSYMRELIIVIVEPFFNVCSFYPFWSNEMVFCCFETERALPVIF